MTRFRCPGRAVRMVPALALILLLGTALAPCPARAAESANKVAGLGLSFAQAAAESKSMAEAAKIVATDEAGDWLLDRFGGLKAIQALNDFSELNDKVAEITGLMDMVKSVATQLGLGNYDQAAIEAADAAVDKLNNPAVSAVWAAAKAAYESHLLVQSTGAARDIEALYGRVERDRRLIGAVGPDSPAQININSDTVDYFFNDYVVTDDSVRALVKSYVTTHLGEEWPEQSWASYLGSLGTASAQDEETLALTGDLRNVARGWIRTLLADVNKQAMVRYQEARLRQENAKFQAFAEKMRAFTGNDLPRLLQLYAAQKVAQAELPKYRELLERARGEYSRISAAQGQEKFNSLPDYQQTGTRMIQSLNAAAAGAYRADDFTLHGELETESGRWAHLMNDMQPQTWAQDVYAREMTAYEKELEKKDAEARAYNAKLARESTATDGSGQPWGSLYDQNLPDYQKVKPFITQFAIDGAMSRMDEVEAQVLEALNRGDTAQASILREQAVVELQAEINAFYDQAVAEVRKAQPKNTQLGKATGDLDQWRRADLAAIETRSSELLGKTTPFYEILSRWSGRLERYNRHLAAIERSVESYPDKLWETGAPELPLALHTAVGGLGEVRDLGEVPYRLRLARSGLASQRVSDAGLDAQAKRIEQEEAFIPWLDKALKDRTPERDQVFTAQDLDTIEALFGADAAATIKDREKALKGILDRSRATISRWRSNLADYANRVRTNNANLEQDIAFLAAKEQEMEAFLLLLRGNDQMLRMDQQGQLLPFVHLGPAGQALAMEPYPHYMNASELNRFGQDWLKRLEAYPQWAFVAKYFPSAHDWAREAAKMGFATPEEQEHIVYGSGALYLKDVNKALTMAGGISHTDEDEWTQGLEDVAALLPMAVRKTASDWFAVDANFKLEPQALRATPTGEAYAALLTRLDEVVTMRAVHLEQQRNAALQAEVQAQQAAADQTAQEAAQDLAAQSMYYAMDVRVNSRPVDPYQGQVTVTRDELENGRIRITAVLSETEGVEGMLLSIDGGRTWDQMPVTRDIGFEFLPAAGQRYDFVLTLKRGGAREDVSLKLLPGAWVGYENVDYNQLVLAAVKTLAEAYETQDSAAFARLISRDYLGNRVFLEEGVRFDFDMFSAIQLRIYVSRITVAKGYATVETKWDKKQIPRTTGQQQATTGRTTMTFVVEDGEMKLRNLRGNLLYATLSPEVAEASGLPMAVVDEIRAARDERTPVQPGAGDVEDAGGVVSGSAISVRTATIEKSTVPPTRGIDFETGTQAQPASGTADLGFEGNTLWSENTAVFQEAGGSFEALTEAPEGGYGPLTGDPVVPGKVYAFRTTEGNYGKFVIDSSTDLGGGLFRNVLRYAVQTNGSRNIRTQ